jgi:hypothetical protein
MIKMIKAFILLSLLAGAIGATSCVRTSPEVYNKQAAAPELLHQTADELTYAIIHDIFKPPVASRIYAYVNIAAYEALRNGYPAYPTLAGKLNGFKPVPKPQKGAEYSFPVAAMAAYLKMSKTLTYSLEGWDKYEKEMQQQYEQMQIPQDVYERSVAYGRQVADHVLAYADQDNYKQSRSAVRYTVTNVPGYWQPTPPTYEQACEPAWNTMRAFTLDSCTQFKPVPPAKYDLNPNSPFFRMVQEVYDYGKNLTPEQKAIAYFWDDNATVSNIHGHVTYLTKKMTPPGHWLAIVKTISKDKKLDMMASLQAYTHSAIALYDAFIACWDEKYRSARIRPVTAIHNTIDPNWEPFLQTPPFPEYVSGHSAISASAGTVLTHLFGDNVAFTDSTEYEFGHGVRSFKSLKEAYLETSMSRIYGGIHFYDGAMEGTRQGEQVGQWVWSKLAQPKESKENIAVSKR